MVGKDVGCMSKKLFSPRLFKENDVIGKTAGIIYLSSLGPGEIEVETTKYGVDLVRTSGGANQSLECEVKKVWKGGAFPYTDVQVLHRKAKYFSVGADLLLLSGNHQDFCIIKSKDIMAAPVEKVSNIYVPQGELFFKVPLKKAMFASFSHQISPNCICQCGGSSYTVMKTTMRCKGCKDEYQGRTTKIIYRSDNRSKT